MRLKTALTALAGLLLTLPAAAQPRAVAMVNGDSIYQDEIEAVIRQRPPALTPLSLSQQRSMRLEILSGLIDDLLLRQHLREKGPKVDAAEVDKSFAALEAAQKMAGKSVADFLRETAQSEAQVRAGILAMLQLAKHVREQATDAELAKYYESNKDYFDKVTVRASHIVIRVAANAAPEEREAARKKLAGVRTELTGGADFAALAKKHSQCPSSEKAGDIGFFTRKWMLDEQFAKAAFAMKVGDLSEVVETDFGFHLIKVTERTPGSKSTLAAVTEDVRDCFMEEVRQNLIAQLRKAASITITLP